MQFAYVRYGKAYTFAQVKIRMRDGEVCVYGRNHLRIVLDDPGWAIEVADFIMKRNCLMMMYKSFKIYSHEDTN